VNSLLALFGVTLAWGRPSGQPYVCPLYPIPYTLRTKTHPKTLHPKPILVLTSSILLTLHHHKSKSRERNSPFHFHPPVQLDPSPFSCLLRTGCGCLYSIRLHPSSPLLLHSHTHQINTRGRHQYQHKLSTRSTRAGGATEAAYGARDGFLGRPAVHGWHTGAVYLWLPGMDVCVCVCVCCLLLKQQDCVHACMFTHTCPAVHGRHAYAIFCGRPGMAPANTYVHTNT